MTYLSKATQQVSGSTTTGTQVSDCKHVLSGFWSQPKAGLAPWDVMANLTLGGKSDSRTRRHLRNHPLSS